MSRWLLVCCITSFCVLVARAEPWPALPQYREGGDFVVMESGIHNGIPHRITGIDSPQSVPALTDWLQRRLPGRHRVDVYPGKTVISAFDGPYMHTVVVSPNELGGALAVQSIARLPSPQERAAYNAERRSWLNLMPAGTRLATHQSSSEQGVHTVQVHFVNHHPLALNIRRLILHFQGAGFEGLGKKDTFLQQQSDRAGNYALVRLVHPRGAEVLITAGLDGSGTWLFVTKTSRMGGRP
jgi:hypothetical protein